MADTDEELVRKLHLEINGLSRPRRARVVHEVPGTHPVPASGPLRRQLEKQQSSGKQAASGTPRTSPPAAEGATGEQRPRQDSVEAGASTRAEQKPRLKRIEKHRDSGGAGQAVRPATTVAVKGELKKELGAAHGEADIAASEPQDFMRQAEPRGSVLHEASEHPAQQEVSGLRSEERVYGAHAAVAAANARKRAAADSNGSAAPVGGGGDAPKRVKCFVNGMRWGFSLPPAAVQTRASLAAALSKGLATELTAPPGRGERLHVVFVDPDGRISEFPPTMEAGWKTAATSSSRVYIKPGSPVR